MVWVLFYKVRPWHPYSSPLFQDISGLVLIESQPVSVVFQVGAFTCLPYTVTSSFTWNLWKRMMTECGLFFGPGLGARLQWALSNSGIEESIFSLKRSRRSWEKKTVGQLPSTYKSTIRMFCLLLLPSNSESLALSWTLSPCNEVHIASSSSRCWFTSSALDSRSMICFPWPETVAWIWLCLVSKFANDDLKSAVSAAPAALKAEKLHC